MYRDVPTGGLGLAEGLAQGDAAKRRWSSMGPHSVSSQVAWSVVGIVSDRGLLGTRQGRRKRENSMKSQGKPEEAPLPFTALLGHLCYTAHEG